MILNCSLEKLNMIREKNMDILLSIIVSLHLGFTINRELREYDSDVADFCGLVTTIVVFVLTQKDD